MPPTNTTPPEAEASNYGEALDAGYLGHAPGKDNDHTVAGVTSTKPGDAPAGEPSGAPNTASAVNAGAGSADEAPTPAPTPAKAAAPTKKAAKRARAPRNRTRKATS